MPVDSITRLVLVLIMVLGGGLQQYHRHFVYRNIHRQVRKESFVWQRAVLSWICTILWFTTIGWPDLLKMGLLPLPTEIRWLGNSLLVAGLGLWIWSQVSLGANWSGRVAKRYNHTLTTTGPYRWVRHPMYTAFIVLSIGTLLATANIIVSLPTILYVILTAARAKPEERLMQQLFGRDYIRYRRRTGRFLPRINRSSRL